MEGSGPWRGRGERAAELPSSDMNLQWESHMVADAASVRPTPHHHPGRVRGDTWPYLAVAGGQNILGSLENPELYYNHLSHSDSGGQGKVEGQ